MTDIRKIWIMAIFFGLIMSTLLFFILNISENEKKQSTQNEKPTQQKEETNPVDETANNASGGLKVGTGKRAISIRVNEIQNVSGFVKPGDRVDVVVVVPSATGENESTQILLQNIKVLAKGSNTTREEAQKEEKNQSASEQTVTLEVLPQEGASLAFAEERGFVTLMLRGEQDHGNSPHVHITLDQINKGEIPK